MRILLTNDDGIFAEGITSLALALHAKGHELFIGAPADNKSCVSHGLTLRDLIIVEKKTLPGLENVSAYAIGGTPADCVRISVEKLSAAPDVIVSGINHAPNLGTDAVYSGTVAAAIEGLMIDLPSIAVSKDTFDATYMDEAAAWFADNLDELCGFFKNGVSMLNVNLPSTKRSEYRGVRCGRAALISYRMSYSEEIAGDGRIGYRVRSEKLMKEQDNDVDDYYLGKGYAVVTPFTYDMTDYTRFDEAKAAFERDY